MRRGVTTWLCMTCVVLGAALGVRAESPREIELAMPGDDVPVLEPARRWRVPADVGVMDTLVLPDRPVVLVRGWRVKVNVLALALYWWPEVVMSLAAVLALWMIRRAWKRGRDRDQPFCRNCGYQLTGSVSPTCPECGADATGRGRVMGQRHPHRRAIALTALLAVALVMASLRGLEWWTDQAAAAGGAGPGGGTGGAIFGSTAIPVRSTAMQPPRLRHLAAIDDLTWCSATGYRLATWLGMDVRFQTRFAVTLLAIDINPAVVSNTTFESDRVMDVDGMLTYVMGGLPGRQLWRKDGQVYVRLDDQTYEVDVDARTLHEVLPVRGMGPPPTEWFAPDGSSVPLVEHVRVHFDGSSLYVLNGIEAISQFRLPAGIGGTWNVISDDGAVIAGLGPAQNQVLVLERAMGRWLAMLELSDVPQMGIPISVIAFADGHRQLVVKIRDRASQSDELLVYDLPPLTRP